MSAQYSYLLQSYKEYLQILGYAPPTVKSWPIHVREFLHWLETRSINSIANIESRHITEFIYYIKQRGNKRSKGTALSSSSINKIINAVNVFIKFLNSTGKYIVETAVHRTENNIGERIILSVAEVKQLYESTFLPNRQNSITVGQRDRAILAIFYGCGLRRSEAINLNITDIDLERKRVFVRKGKGNKQRYVPIAAKHAADLKDYLQEGRGWFLYNHADRYNHAAKGKPYERKETADDITFFISMSGSRMQSFYQRLENMRQLHSW